jgi:hypothetical protein
LRIADFSAKDEPARGGGFWISDFGFLILDCQERQMRTFFDFSAKGGPARGGGLKVGDKLKRIWDCGLRIADPPQTENVFRTYLNVGCWTFPGLYYLKRYP